MPCWIDVTASRMPGTAFIAPVVLGSPALRPTRYCTVRPSALTYVDVARYAWYSAAGTCTVAGGTGGNAWAGPSWACSCANGAGVSGARFGFTGPTTAVNCPDAASFCWADARTCGSLHADRGSANNTLVGDCA